MKKVTVSGFISPNHYYDFLLECSDRHVEVTGTYNDGELVGSFQGPTDALKDAAAAVGVFAECP